MSDFDGPPTAAEILVLPSVPQSVARIRRFAMDACRASGFASSCDAVALLVSEVATNALVHGAGDVRVRVAATGASRLRVEVYDGGPGTPSVGAAGPDDEGGRGMALVQALSAGWGVRTEPDGKTVWFEVAP